MSNFSSALVALLVILGIGVLVLIIVAWCKIFKKAGIHPGKFFIPGYGAYLCYSIADSTGLFFASLAVSVISSIISQIMLSSYTSSYSYYSGYSSSPSGIIILYIIEAIILLVINIAFCLNLSRVFGKTGAFAAGLFFLYPVFISILGFGSAQYHGYNGSSFDSLPTGPVWKCPSCGAENPAHKGVCECGTHKP